MSNKTISEMLQEQITELQGDLRVLAPYKRRCEEALEYVEINKGEMTGRHYEHLHSILTKEEY